MNREIAIEEVVITDSFVVSNGDMKPAAQPLGAACGFGCGGIGCGIGSGGAGCGVTCGGAGCGGGSLGAGCGAIC